MNMAVTHPTATNPPPPPSQFSKPDVLHPSPCRTLGVPWDVSGAVGLNRNCTGFPSELEQLYCGLPRMIMYHTEEASTASSTLGVHSTCRPCIPYPCLSQPQPLPQLATTPASLPHLAPGELGPGRAQHTQTRHGVLRVCGPVHLHQEVPLRRHLPLHHPEGAARGGGRRRQRQTALGDESWLGAWATRHHTVVEVQDLSSGRYGGVGGWWAASIRLLRKVKVGLEPGPRGISLQCTGGSTGV